MCWHYYYGPEQKLYNVFGGNVAVWLPVERKHLRQAWLFGKLRQPTLAWVLCTGRMGCNRTKGSISPMTARSPELFEWLAILAVFVHGSIQDVYRFEDVEVVAKRMLVYVFGVLSILLCWS